MFSVDSQSVLVKCPSLDSLIFPDSEVSCLTVVPYSHPGLPLSPCRLHPDFTPMDWKWGVSAPGPPGLLRGPIRMHCLLSVNQDKEAALYIYIVLKLPTKQQLKYWDVKHPLPYLHASCLSGEPLLQVLWQDSARIL